MVPAETIGEGDELSGNGSDDDLVRFSGLSQALGEDFQAWIVMRGDKPSLVHHTPQSTTPAIGPDRGR
jgi:hypothetical protein